MINKIIENISNKYELKEIEVNDFSSFKASGMKFKVHAYKVEGLGHLSVMEASGFFGLMKMDTVILVPFNKDLPLYSYDRIFAMGNDTLIVELYDTCINKNDYTRLKEIKDKFAYLTERDPGKHWYDSIKLNESISKIGKKKNSKEFDTFALEHLIEFLSIESNLLLDISKKKELTNNYVEGLLKNGGPSTDVFVKMFGLEKTKELYRTVLFGLDL